MVATLGAAMFAAAVVLFVVGPLLTGREARVTRTAAEFTDAEAWKLVTLRALRDVEYDYHTGKLDSTDYEALKNELTAEAAEFVKLAEKAGSPDPRVLRIITRSPAGRAWYRYWQALNDGELDKPLKELVRVKIAFDHSCGYCSTVRNAGARDAGLTEDKIQEVWDFENSSVLSAREKMALRFAHYIKWDIDKADSDSEKCLRRSS